MKERKKESSKENEAKNRNETASQKADLLILYIVQYAERAKEVPPHRTVIP